MKSKNNRQALSLAVGNKVSLKKSRRVKGGSGNANKQKNMAKNLVLGNPDLVNYMLEYAQIDVPFVVVLMGGGANEIIFDKGTKENYKYKIIQTIYDNQYEEFIETVVDGNKNMSKEKIIKNLHKEYEYYEEWETNAFVSGKWIDVDISLNEIVEYYFSNNSGSDSGSNYSGSNYSGSSNDESD